MSHLSETGGGDRFIAIPRDPSTLFAYWDLSADVIEQVETRIGKATLAASTWIIRLTHLGTSAVSNVPIDPDADNWYITVQAGASYEVELGVLRQEGDFHCVYANPPVRMPNATISTTVDRQWMIPEEDYLKLLSLGWAGFLGSSSDLHLPTDEDEETAFVTVMPPAPPIQTDSATSPGTPEYTGRR